MPRATVIPTLAYADVGEAIAWLTDTFGFTLRLGIGGHRAQMNVGDGAMVITQRPPDDDDATGGGTSRRSGPAHSVMVRVDDVREHHARASRRGARILQPPTDFPYGERQYSVQDLGGHVWTFSESIADVDPVSWGGTPGKL